MDFFFLNFDENFFTFKFKMGIAGRPTILVFDRITITEIGCRFKGNTNECIRWCREFNLLSTAMTCP